VTHVPPSARLRRVFVDSSAYLALLDHDDRHHAEAVAIVGALADRGYRQYTTNVLLIECHALVLSVLGRHQARRFLQDVEGGNTTVIRVRASDEQRARGILFRYTDKDFSFNDAISFVVMERLGIEAVFTFDRDFAQYGFVVPGADEL
jgi:uncharacterized protein